MMYITEVIMNSGIGAGISLTDNRAERPNPCQEHTEQGFVLEIYYGAPDRLHTPWGTWLFFRSLTGNWDAILPGILSRLGATLHRPLEQTRMGEFGPFYALTSIDGQALPPLVLCAKAKRLNYDEAVADWKAMTAIHPVV